MAEELLSSQETDISSIVNNKRALKAEDIAFDVSQNIQKTETKNISQLLAKWLSKKIRSIESDIKKFDKKAVFLVLHEVLSLYQQYHLLITEDERQEFKKQFQSELLNLTNQSGFCSYCYEKPRGYPGDFGAMERIWKGRTGSEQDPQTDITTIGKLLSEFTFGLENCLANEYRVHYLKKYVQDPRFSVIASIGSGSAIEVRESLDSSGIDKKEFHFYDQDNGALESIETHLAKLANQLHFYSGSIFRSILKTLDEKYDLIYSSGLFDYFDIDSSKKLAKILWKKLKPGGCLIITNAHPDNPTRLWMEYVADWNLKYKTESEMYTISEELSPKNQVVEKDPYGVYQYLIINK